MKLPLDSDIPIRKVTHYLLVPRVESDKSADYTHPIVRKKRIMKLELYKHAVIAIDLPDLGLKRGDLVTVVDELQATDGEDGYAVEVFNALGETLDVHMLPASALEPASEDEILCVRRVESAA